MTMDYRAAMDIYRTAVPLQYRIISYTYQRETAFLSVKGVTPMELSTRMMKVHNIQHLNYVMGKLHIWDRDKTYNLYISVAKYIHGIPNQTMELQERNNEAWNESHWMNMDSYDMFIDIDSQSHRREDMRLAREQALRLWELLEKVKMPFRSYFSGCGFHFIIPSSELPILNRNPDNRINVYNHYYELAKLMKEKLELFSLDDGVYDAKRLRKCPFSLAIYEGMDNPLLVLPIQKSTLQHEFRLTEFIYGRVNYRSIVDELHNHQYLGQLKYQELVKELI